MHRSAIRLPLAIALLFAVSACGADGATNGTTAGANATPAADMPDAPDMPDTAQLPERVRKNLARAFASASEGRDPTMDCTSVVGRVASNPPPEGQAVQPDRVRAFELCYIDVTARYIETLLAQITPGADQDSANRACDRIASHVVISRGSLGSFAGNVQLERKALDARRLERVQHGMQEKCPYILEVLTEEL